MQNPKPKKIVNIAKAKPITANTARNIAESQELIGTLDGSYNQILQRTSNAVLGGLRYGAPPPIVGG